MVTKSLLFFSLNFLNHSIRAHAAVPDCGVTQNTIEARVADCSRFPGSFQQSPNNESVRWYLVVRKFDLKTGRSYEVWQDLNGLLWGDMLEGTYTLRQAYSFPPGWPAPGSPWPPAIETACTSLAGILANGGITERKFGVPTWQEVHSSPFHDDITSYMNPQSPHNTVYFLPNSKGHLFWTNTVGLDPSGVFSRVFGDAPAGYLADEYESLRVRCVGR